MKFINGEHTPVVGEYLQRIDDPFTTLILEVDYDDCEIKVQEPNKYSYWVSSEFLRIFFYHIHENWTEEKWK
jgi:hypothetical protein